MNAGTSSFRTVVSWLVVCVLQIAATLPAGAVPIPSAQLSYSETYDATYSASTGKNWWSYGLTLSNTSDITNPGQDVSSLLLYYFDIPVESGGSFIGKGLASGWSSFSAPSWDGTTIYSLSPDVTADFGSEIAPGHSLGGFSFLLDYQTSYLSLNALVWNPDGDPFALTVRGSSTSSPVPEPSTMVLLVVGLFGFLGWKLRRVRRL